MHTRVPLNDAFLFFALRTEFNDDCDCTSVIIIITIIVVNFCGNLMYNVQYVERVLFARGESRCVCMCVLASAFRKYYLGRLRVWVITKIYVYVVSVEHVSHCRERR